MRNYAILTVAATLALNACGGGGGSSSTPSGGGETTTQSEAMVSTANDVGSQLKTLSTYERDIASAAAAATTSTMRASAALGTSKNYTELFAPDKNGDPNSTQTQYFYDSACTQLARDIVRIYTSTGASAETVARTVKQYALGNATPIATRSDSPSRFRTRASTNTASRSRPTATIASTATSSTSRAPRLSSRTPSW